MQLGFLCEEKKEKERIEYNRSCKARGNVEGENKVQPGL